MEHFIGCDAHKKFSVFVAVNEKGQAGEALRVAHDRQLYCEFLARLPAHSTIAVEASGSYSWLVDEMERSGHRPKLCNPLEAKRRMGLTKKTDTLDALMWITSGYPTIQEQAGCGTLVACAFCGRCFLFFPSDAKRPVVRYIRLPRGGFRPVRWDG